jgi:hypothetical protein
MNYLKITILLIGICLLPDALQAQNIELSGFIQSDSGEPLSDVNILLNDEIGTSTNKFGAYKIELEPGNYQIKLSHVGFESVSKEIMLTADTKENFTLSECSIQLKDVMVSVDEKKNLQKISKIDINLRPIQSSQEVLRIIPGLFIAQHAGGGKAEQIFLRGFDIDHGTDITLSVDGMPVNMVSHAHGQGYSDLHFLIPETIEQVDFNKGPYYADQGNFNTAGYAGFKTKS